ncbi:hypothetical protein IMG5_171760 [Ichthyophthirius multifiliis]|uniref:Transmembrane protein n=1 Tax=Ichthyophthirius multifiliis TaxID=5932 RepID=G0R1N7_ICHMU|nr:hypothetical protein IMG5_171760 [Ichthyophthirius multifiliis]EGR28614.1 hypothetical protein IMG5_171760 [Ichthyophthirius multifiliis]|eukprot:XP_004029850.1 hypothetical protein IMG5_171760 [Ichthyophthirius multifiliis]
MYLILVQFPLVNFLFFPVLYQQFISLNFLKQTLNILQTNLFLVLDLMHQFIYLQVKKCPQDNSLIILFFFLLKFLQLHMFGTPFYHFTCINLYILASFHVNDFKNEAQIIMPLFLNTYNLVNLFLLLIIILNRSLSKSSSLIKFHMNFLFLPHFLNKALFVFLYYIYILIHKLKIYPNFSESILLHNLILLKDH